MWKRLVVLVIALVLLPAALAQTADNTCDRACLENYIDRYMDEMLISRYFRDGRLFSIGGGTDEIMREIIAKIELG